jgi:hypothetical protein
LIDDSSHRRFASITECGRRRGECAFRFDGGDGLTTGGEGCGIARREQFEGRECGDRQDCCGNEYFDQRESVGAPKGGAIAARCPKT